jgi:D-xylose transport system ATP-binding protein
MTASRTPILEINGVSRSFGGISALTGVSLSVCPGEVVALCGDNGAGKSTLVKVISGIISPNAGDITFEGKQITLGTPQAAAAHGIQTVYQDLALCDNLDTVQNLFLGRERAAPWYRGAALDRASMEGAAGRILKELDVKIRDLTEPVGSLSGGQRQCVAILRGLITDPKVMLLDEPTAALGVAQRKQVLALIERLRAQGRAVILISHDLGDVLQVADRVVVLRLGSKVGEFERGKYTREDLISRITGADLPNPAAGDAQEVAQ